MIQSRKDDSTKKVKATLQVLKTYIKKRKPLNLTAIAKEAGVSLKFLYTNPVVSAKIKEIQGMPINTTTENTELVIKSLKKQLEETRKQVADLTNELTDENGIPYKELYEQEKAKRIELENKLKDRFDPFTGLPISG